MARRSRSTFKKRQKELARQQKRQDKLARRLNRKKDREGGAPGEDVIGEDGLPLDGDLSPDQDAPDSPEEQPESDDSSRQSG